MGKYLLNSLEKSISTYNKKTDINLKELNSKGLN